MTLLDPTRHVIVAALSAKLEPTLGMGSCGTRSISNTVIDTESVPFEPKAEKAVPSVPGNPSPTP
jgi:hypothetical protein